MLEVVRTVEERNSLWLFKTINTLVVRSWFILFNAFPNAVRISHFLHLLFHFFSLSFICHHIVCSLLFSIFHILSFSSISTYSFLSSPLFTSRHLRSHSSYLFFLIFSFVLCRWMSLGNSFRPANRRKIIWNSRQFLYELRLDEKIEIFNYWNYDKNKGNNNNNDNYNDNNNYYNYNNHGYDDSIKNNRW